MSGDHLNHHNSPNDWQFGSPSAYQGIQMASSSCPQVSMPESFYTNPWSNPANPQNSGFTDGNAAIGKPVPLPPPRLDVGVFSPSLSDFPADSSFIERAARFSSFGAGNLSALANPFGRSNVQAPKNEAVMGGSMSGSPVNYQRDDGGGREERPDMANLSGDSSSRGLSSKKRKNSGQGMELDQVQEEKQFSDEIRKEENPETKQNVECSSLTGKSNGKNAKGSTDGAKQDYVHVRARRGQATNSHSLAERVRRERISERMKYLQELVPGCSKVTGKAVMLDEIINYVQSLQRQVEFLSMKLAAVNPSIELNIEGLLCKNMLQSRVGPSPAGISPELLHPQFLQSQQGLVHNGIPNIVNHADALRRAVTSEFTTTNGFKEPTPQMTNWETEIQNMAQMNFGTDPSPNTQEFNAKSNNGFSQ